MLWPGYGTNILTEHLLIVISDALFGAKAETQPLVTAVVVQGHCAVRGK